MAKVGQQFRLGRHCALTIDNGVMVGIEDVSIRLVASKEVDATRFGSAIASSVVTHRALEVTVSTPDYAVGNYIRQKTSQNVGGYFLPTIVSVSFFHGLYHGQTWDFTVHDVDCDEPLNGPVRTRFVLKQFTNTNDVLPNPPNAIPPTTMRIAIPGAPPGTPQFAYFPPS